MPNKGQRIAQRQGELARRKRRAAHTDTGHDFDEGPAVSTTPEAVGTSAASKPVASQRISSTVAPAASPTRRRSRPTVSRDVTPVMLRFVGGELRQTLIISAVLIAGLVAASMFLEL